MANGAIDVFDGSAVCANKMVVVVSRASFVSCRGACRLDSSHQSGIAEIAKHVVNGLHGECRMRRTHRCAYRFSIAVRHCFERLEEGDAAARHTQPGIPEFACEGRVHPHSLAVIVNDSK